MSVRVSLLVIEILRRGKSSCTLLIDTGFSRKVLDRSNFEKQLGLGLARLTRTE